MSLSTRRRSRRKLRHEAKNLEDVLFPQANSSYTNFNGVKPKERDHRHTHHHHQRNDASRKGSRSKSRKQTRKSSDSSRSPHSVSSWTITGSRGSSSKSLFHRPSMTALGLSDLELGSVSFRIGQVTYKMDDKGYWSSSSDICKNLHEATATLREENKRTAQENNMLRVKNELLANMIAKKTIRKEKIEKELDRLRKLLSSSSSRFSVSTTTANKK